MKPVVRPDYAFTCHRCHKVNTLHSRTNINVNMGPLTRQEAAKGIFAPLTLGEQLRYNLLPQPLVGWTCGDCAHTACRNRCSFATRYRVFEEEGVTRTVWEEVVPIWLPEERRMGRHYSGPGFEELVAMRR
jgi:hypothetical protein